MRQRYVIAVKREQRGSVRSDWVERLGAVQGVTVTGATAQRAIIECEPFARGELELLYGDLLHIEPIVEHHTSEGADAPETETNEPDGSEHSEPPEPLLPE